MAALNETDTENATASLTEANRLLDTWIGHLELGRAYFAAAKLRRRTRNSISASAAVVRRWRYSSTKNPRLDSSLPFIFTRGE